MRDPANDFWRFSLRVYRAPGVEQACLALQERSGADVNLLLFCGWVGQGGRALDRRRLRQAMARVGAWQAEVVLPLRQTRRAIKRRSLDGPLAATATALRKRILALELELEHVEQCLLAELAGRWPPAARPRSPEGAVRASLVRYLELLGQPRRASDLSFLARLVAACVAGAEPGAGTQASPRPGTSSSPPPRR
jgi:uncharacterized protein (TIGR02444 family)